MTFQTGFSAISAWRNELVNKLNNRIFSKDDWQEFIFLARQFGCYAMADDMERRMNHYAKEFGK